MKAKKPDNSPVTIPPSADETAANAGETADTKADTIQIRVISCPTCGQVTDIDYGPEPSPDAAEARDAAAAPAPETPEAHAYSHGFTDGRDSFADDVALRAPPPFAGMVSDAEAITLASIVHGLEDLDRQAQLRIATYVGARYL